MVAVNPYATALALNRPAPTHVRPGVYDADRVRSYYTYEDVWNNVPDAYAALLREGDDPLARRYIPAVRSIVEATNRYLGHDLAVTWEPILGAEVDEQAMLDWGAYYTALTAREELGIKFLSMKRWWLIKGDSLLAIGADPLKEQGSRLRLTEIEPEQYFPIIDPADASRVSGCYLASIVKDEAGEDIVQRIEYHKLDAVTGPALGGVPGQIFHRVGFFELTGWDDRPGDDPQDIAEVDPPPWASDESWAELLAGVVLPPLITAIPVYHFRNNRRGGAAGSYGTSEIQGLESIFAGIIQNTTDEDLAVALQGLGVYWTDSGRPRDSNGRDLPWEIGPASMIELEKDGKLGRVDGVGSVQPIQDHMNFMTNSARESSGVPDIAVGRIDAQAAQSGVALRIEFMPILAKNQEKEEELISKLTHMLHDLLTMWVPAYEQITPPLLQPVVTFGDPIPTDRAATLAEILQMVAAKVVSIEWAQTELANKLGYVFPTNMLAAIVAEDAQLLDATGARIDAAANGAPPADPADQ
jgi:hypothetical protein